MAVDHGLLAHVLPMLTREKERAATEALNYVLNRSDSARRRLETMLDQAGAAVGEISQTETEVEREQQGRVDLVAYDPEGRERALIEAKFWADLTEHQPNTYLERLESRVPSVLLFVCPESRAEALWSEILRRCDRKFRVEQIAGGDILRKAAVGKGSRWLMLTSWQHLLSTIADGSSQRDKCNIAQLEGLVAYMEKDRYVPWEEADLRQDIPRKIRGLRQIITDAVERGKKDDWGIAEQSARVSTGIECGQYLFLGGVGVWFGIDFDSWAKHGKSPVWVQLNEKDLPECDSALHRIQRNRAVDKIRLHEQYQYFPIDIPVGEDVSSVVTSVVVQLNNIARLIDNSVARYRQG